MSLTRRGFLGSSFGMLAPALSRHREYDFRHDYVLGTSLDVVLRAPSQATAEQAHDALLDEIERLRKILSTYDPASEISRINAGHASTSQLSHDLAGVLDAYARWSKLTGGVIESRLSPGAPLNVDALGKAYIADRAANAAGLNGLFNLGGDIVVRGSTPRIIAIVDPRHPADNALPLTHIEVADQAVATSGIAERGQHLLDPRTGEPAAGAASATVVANDAITANALSTALCIVPAHEGLPLVERTPGTHALVVNRDGTILRTSGFARLELPRLIRAAAASGWQNGYEVSVTLTLKSIEGFRVHRPYVAVWAEDNSGKLVRNITVWANKPRWMPELHAWWSRNDGSQELYNITKPTRPPGRYRIVWDGLDEKGQPVPQTSYRIVVETNREHGNYAKESGVLECGAKPSKLSLKETSEFEEVLVEYGPKGQSA